MKKMEEGFLNNNEQPKKQEGKEGFTLKEAKEKYEEERKVKDKLLKVLKEKVKDRREVNLFPLILGNALEDKFFPRSDLEKAEYNEKKSKHIFYQIIIGSSLPSEANYGRDKDEKFFVFDEIDEKIKKIVELLIEKIETAAAEKEGGKISGEELKNILEEVLNKE